MKKTSKYPKALILLHWITVLLIVFVFYKGTVIEELDFTEANMNTFRLHAVPGMLILILTIIRIVIKRKNKNKLPVDIEYYSPLHKMMVNTVMRLLYVLLILTPAIGFIMIYKTGALTYDFGGAFPTGAEFSETLEVLHKIFVFTLVGLVAIHVIGVITYKFKKGQNLLTRMCLLIE